MGRRIGLSILVLLVVICLCLSLLAAAAMFLLLSSRGVAPEGFGPHSGLAIVNYIL